ncbi:chemotaxis protein [Clostridium sp. 19966]|uniref:methyl-accepting chemotaxis protein n=1 Tax=Clostridium sp. 19966 TaxID=2768166 RepID=UPI0028DF26A4|nr:methyl-accepting chemotaxis protein [Clostridium sp. 19966]MDT8715405.1 chemotaxis protein [Clostridium sp. 19966]
MAVENEIIESMAKLLTYLPKLFEDEISLAVTDKHKYVKIALCDALPLNIQEGEEIPEGGAAFKALKSGENTITNVDASVYGVEFKSYAVPLKHNGEVVGLLLAAKSLGSRKRVTELSDKIATALQQISDTVQSLTQGINSAVSANENILYEVEQANENAKGTDSVLKLVQNVSSQTNLLGLNAAIEAARAGEMGKGFSVVAGEIRKLAGTSSESIKKIDSVLESIQASVEKIAEKVKESSEVFEEQAASFEEIVTAVKDITDMARQLDELSKQL